MAAVPVTFTGLLFDKKNKTQQNVTFIGLASLTGLGVGGGPVEPPPDIQPEPPLEIWGGPFDPPHPAHPIVLPPLPEQPPDPTTPPGIIPKPHEGWNWSAAKQGWYYLHIPGPGDAQPKK